uniref:Uncharacterized protein n=1 Tax=Oryza meridionalis TaxID=40149 RepID=A0A0E0EWJ6_9ORYZ
MTRKKERWLARVDGEDGAPVLAVLGEGMHGRARSRRGEAARLATATAQRESAPVTLEVLLEEEEDGVFAGPCRGHSSGGLRV